MRAGIPCSTPRSEWAPDYCHNELMPWRVKTWEYVAVVADDVFLAAAIAHLGYLGFAFAYAFDRNSGVCKSFGAIIPLAMGTRVAIDPTQGGSHFSYPFGRIDIENRPRTLKMRFTGVIAAVRFEEVLPWEVRWLTRGGGENRTFKAMGLPASGFCEISGRRHAIAGHGLLDWTVGRPARETEWRWAAGVGRAGETLMAWNFRTGFDDPAQRENVVWISGIPRQVGLATIEPPREDAAPAVWTVSQGGLKLNFEEHGQRQESLNLGLIASRYRQPWGRFSGTFEGAPVDGYGVAEDHWARW